MNVAEAAAHFLGYRYAARSADNRVPVVWGCLPVSLAHQAGDARVVDCSTFISAVAVYMSPDVEWDRGAYSDLQIMDPARLWSPLDAWERHGLGTALPAGIACQGWGLYQSWVDTDRIRGGHQWAYHGAMNVRVHSSSIGNAGPTWERVPFAELVSKYPAGIRGVEL